MRYRITEITQSLRVSLASVCFSPVYAETEYIHLLYRVHRIHFRILFHYLLPEDRNGEANTSQFVQIRKNQNTGTK
jgi:hypothetical protein